MRILHLSLVISIILSSPGIAAAQNSNLSGTKQQDSIMKALDSKFKGRSVRTKRSKIHFGADSVLYYALNKKTNQLVSMGFTDMKNDSRTMYDLIDGELLRVRYMPNHRKGNPTTVYYFENGKLIYKKERNADTPKAEKLIEDIRFFKKAIGID